jgi:hypothetical protein
MHTLYGLENAAADEQVFGRVEWVSGVLQRVPTSVLQSVVHEERPSASSEAAGNVSERKDMKIDIQIGDVFRITHIARLAQYRGDKCRFVGECAWIANDEVITKHFKVISDDFARQIILAAGHTITEATPPPTPVPWPKFCVVHNTHGGILFYGSYEQCRSHIGVSDAGIKSIHPLAPAPLSPALLEFMENVAKNEGNAIVTAAAARKFLLAEGGAA